LDAAKRGSPALDAIVSFVHRRCMKFSAHVARRKFWK
jgi:hypothetical protein